MLRIKSALILLCAIFLAGCSQASPVSTVPFPSKPVPNYKTVSVTRGTFELIAETTASFVYPEVKTLECEFDNAIVSVPISFSENETFKKGDVLATYRFEASQATLEQMELDLYQANRSAALQIESYENRISQYAQAAAAGGTEGRIAELQRKRTQNELAIYKEKTYASLRKQTQAVEDYRALFTEKALIAPEDGIFTEFVSIPEGTALKKGASVISYTPGTQRLLKLLNIPEEIRQLASPGMEVTISYSKESYKGRICASPIGIDEKLDNDAVYISSDHFADMEDRSFYYISCKLLEIRDVLLLDPAAVSYDGDTAYVMVLQNGEAVKQEIVCGMDNGKALCVLDGLSEGDLVITNY